MPLDAEFFSLSDTHIKCELHLVVALSIIGNIQLSCKHSLNTGHSREIAEAWARSLSAFLVKEHPEITGLADVLELGWSMSEGITPSEV